MKRRETIQLRLFNQGLSTNRFEKAEEVVAHFGAMQAQDYSMALWAVGLRTTDPNRSVIENQIRSGKIIRTHILRPTWHLVHQKDIRWMMELSAPNVKKAVQYVDRNEGLTDELFKKAWKIIERQCNKVNSLTKKDIMICLSRAHLSVGNLLATQIIIRAELEMFLCNGEEKGTYTLFEKRVPVTDRIPKSEAIVKLAQLYFNSRGPATLKDFAWWSGLSMTEAKIGVAELNNRLNSFTLDQVKYFYFDIKNKVSEKPVFSLLPCYDEYTVGYSEGRVLALPTHIDQTKIGNGIFKPIVLSENEIVGIWKTNKQSPFVEIDMFAGNKKIPAKKIEEGIKKFNLFNK
jgi:hypothetical protein